MWCSLVHWWLVGHISLEQEWSRTGVCCGQRGGSQGWLRDWTGLEKSCLNGPSWSLQVSPGQDICESHIAISGHSELPTRDSALADITMETHSVQCKEYNTTIYCIKTIRTMMIIKNDKCLGIFCCRSLSSCKIFLIYWSGKYRWTVSQTTSCYSVTFHSRETLS